MRQGIPDASEAEVAEVACVSSGELSHTVVTQRQGQARVVVFRTIAIEGRKAERLGERLRAAPRIKRAEQFRRGAKVGLAQSIQGFGEIEQTRLSRVAQHAERAGQLEAALPGGRSAGEVVQQHDVSVELFGELDGGAFTGMKARKRWVSPQRVRVELKPVGRVVGPCPHACGRARVAKFSKDGLCDGDATVELGQNILGANHHEVAQRRGVADDGHAPRACRRVAKSRSRSASV